MKRKMGIQAKRKSWYTNSASIYPLVASMKNKEVVLMDRQDNSKVVRGIFIKTIQYLEEYFLQAFDFFNRDYNVYVSCSRYNHIPLFTFNLKERSAETIEWFKNESIGETFAYDVLIDFDCGTAEHFSMMCEEVVYLLRIFDKFRICYYYYPSGNNFQIVLPFENFKLKIKDNFFSRDITNVESFNFFTRKLVGDIKERFSLKYLDLKGIGTYNKVMKCPYSLVSDKVVLPLKTEKLKNFNYYEMDSNIVLKSVFMFKRGLCLHNYINKETNQKNMSKFLYTYFLENPLVVK